MKPFCELIVASVLPGIRALITKDLIQQGFNQQEISKRLGITQPAISQYKRDLRGSSIKLLRSNKEVMSLIKSLSKNIARGDIEPRDIHLKMCEICLRLRRQRVICKLHGDSFPL
ncbi:MAG: helix-turn-helix domain-containing protein [Candidatus Aenigmarchaeota archaeon]|nr:helix-turn-helix domain-containing protein [Candidatus Aenigmarchaeota archaeon]